jgi:hypothetical protein
VETWPEGAADYVEEINNIEDADAATLTGGGNADSLHEHIDLPNLNSAAVKGVELYDNLAHTAATGIINGGGILSINADPTKFDLSAGSGFIFDIFTDPDNPVITEVSWAAFTAQTTTFVASDNLSWILIDNGGSIVQQNTEPTREQHRTHIIIGVLVHPVATITATGDQSHAVDTYLTEDLTNALGKINISGNNFNPAATDLTLRREAGTSFLPNANRATNAKDPNTAISPVDTGLTFLYIYNDGSEGLTVVSGQTNIDPEQYDDGSGTLAAVGNNKWTNQLCYFNPDTGVSFIRYGDTIYNSKSEAENAVNKAPISIGTGVTTDLIRTVITVKKGETNLTSTDTVFTNTGRFGLGVGGGSVGGSVVDTTAIHTDAAAEISGITSKATPVAADYLVIEDSADSDNKKSVTISSMKTALDLSGTNSGDEIVATSEEVTTGTDNDKFVSPAALNLSEPTLKSLIVNHTATAPDEHALEVIADAAGFGDVKAIDIVYVTGSISTGQDQAINLVNIDESAALGGDITAYEVLATEGSAKIFGLLAGAQVHPVEQLSGTFVDMDSALVNAVDRLTEFLTAGSDVEFFSADNDTVTIGDAAKFEELEFLLATPASQNCQITFEYSTGVGTWGTFTPVDGTNGMTNTGVIQWLDSDIPSWAVGTGSEYLIRLTRTRNNLTTAPIESKVQISAVTEYCWDKDGKINVNEVTANNFSGVTQSMLTQEINAQTGTTYTLVDADHGKLVTLDNAAAIALNVNTGLRADFACAILQKGAGVVTIGGTATVNEFDGFTDTAGQWALASISHLGSDIFFAQGRLA